MSINFTRVQPGDLITAEFMNGLFDTLEALDTRLSTLETSGGSTATPRPVLNGRLPTGDVNVGDALTLFGRNFLRPSDQNTVLLGPVPINHFDALSDETRLIFPVPNLFAGLPRSMPLQVTNANGVSQEIQVRILPLVLTQGGRPAFTPQTPTLGQINEGATYTLIWLVDSQTVLPANYNFTLVFTNVSGTASHLWVTSIAPAGPRRIVPGHPLSVTASITVPAGAVSADIALQATSDDDLIIGTSSTTTFNVGHIAEISDPRAVVTLGTITPLDPVSTTPTPNVVRAATIGGVPGAEIQFETTGHIPIQLFVTANASAAGLYTFSAEVEDAAGLWVREAIAPPPSPARPSNSTLPFLVTVQNTDRGSSAAVKQLVVRAAHRAAGATVDDFVSFVRLPIRGYLP